MPAAKKDTRRVKLTLATPQSKYTDGDGRILISGSVCDLPEAEAQALIDGERAHPTEAEATEAGDAERPLPSLPTAEAAE